MLSIDSVQVLCIIQKKSHVKEINSRDIYHCKKVVMVQVKYRRFINIVLKKDLCFGYEIQITTYPDGVFDCLRTYL